MQLGSHWDSWVRSSFIDKNTKQDHFIFLHRSFKDDRTALNYFRNFVNLADLVGAVACLMCDCDVQLDIIFIWVL